MIKIYRKTATIKAEQFDGSDDMVKKYNILVEDGDHTKDYSLADEGVDPVVYQRYFILTSAGVFELYIGSYIATGVNDEHWPIADDVFKKTYAELPVIPKEVADWIEKCKNDGTSVGDMLCSERRPEKMRDWMALTPGTYEFNQRRYKEHQELVARAWLDGYVVEKDK